jgi:hypothetical protein
MRRRLREQLRLREALLLDLGALVYELHRQGRRAPELLQQKAAELTVVDEEVRELQAALDGSDRPAQETTEGEAIAGGEGELDEEPGEDGEDEDELREAELGGDELGGDDERVREGELREDELDDGAEAGGDRELREGEASGNSELRPADELAEENELGDTSELDALAEGDEQLEGGDPAAGGAEAEDSYDAPLARREEPRA